MEFLQEKNDKLYLSREFVLCFDVDVDVHSCIHVTLWLTTVMHWQGTFLSLVRQNLSFQTTCDSEAE